MGVACVTKLVKLSNLVPRPPSLFWERGISDLLFCTLTFVIFLVSARLRAECSGHWAKERGAAVLRKFCAGERINIALFAFVSLCVHL